MNAAPVYQLRCPKCGYVYTGRIMAHCPNCGPKKKEEKK